MKLAHNLLSYHWLLALAMQECTTFVYVQSHIIISYRKYFISTKPKLPRELFSVKLLLNWSLIMLKLCV